jgi:hypothetical protein
MSKLDIGCGVDPSGGYIGIDPILGTDFWTFTIPDNLSEVMFSHSVYMLNGVGAPPRQICTRTQVRKSVQMYLCGLIDIFELNEQIFSPERFWSYFENLSARLRELSFNMPPGARFVFEQPMLVRMAKTRISKFKYIYLRLTKKKIYTLENAIDTEFFQTHNFFTVDEALIRRLLSSADILQLEIRDGVLMGSPHYDWTCRVIVASIGPAQSSRGPAG